MVKSLCKGSVTVSNRRGATGRRLRLVPCLCAVLIACGVQPVCAFNFDDQEKLEKVELKERRERATQAEVARCEEQARREDEASRQATANRPSGGGGNGRGYVSVEADCVTGTPCDVSNLTIGNGPGRFEPAWRAARSGAIHQGSGGLAGQYSYAFTIEKGGRRCVATGSFSVHGSIGDVKLNHYPDCRLASVHGF